MSTAKPKKMRSPKVGDKVNGSIIKRIEIDAFNEVYLVEAYSENSSGGSGRFTLPLSFVVEETSRDEFESMCKPLIKWINDNANPHAIIVIDGTSAVLYSGEKSVLTDEFIKD